jgi:hypothetical protein
MDGGAKLRREQAEGTTGLASNAGRAQVRSYGGKLSEERLVLRRIVNGEAAPCGLCDCVAGQAG